MNPPDLAQLTREEAVALLRSRFTRVGALLGVILALLWTFGFALLSSAFPPIGDPTFFVFLFVALVLLGGGGAMLGRWYSGRIVAKGQK